MQKVYLLYARRTPFGRLQGSLMGRRVEDLMLPLFQDAIHAMQPLHIDWEAADMAAYVGVSNQAGEDARNIARQIVMLSPLPAENLPAYTLNALCNSGIVALQTAIQAIQTNATELAFVGAVENMSRAPMVRHRISQEEADTLIGWRFLHPQMPAPYALSMLETAELTAQKWGFSRSEQDAYAYQSRQNFAHAQKMAIFEGEILPLPELSQDEQARTFSPESLARLPSIQKGGTITLGNSARAGDGAALLLLASEDFCARHTAAPLLHFQANCAAATTPQAMSEAAAIATRRLLQRHSFDIESLDSVLVSESFATQALVFLRQFPQMPPTLLNAWGGAISTGNPTSVGNLRLVCQLAHSPKHIRRALIATASGLGLGAALVLEK